MAWPLVQPVQVGDRRGKHAHPKRVERKSAAIACVLAGGLRWVD
jgi:hypothetical protein